MRASTLLVLVVAGCASAPQPRLTDPGPATLDLGWSTLASENQRVSIGVPPQWRIWTEKADQEAARAQFSQQLDEFMPQGGPSSDEIAQGLAEQARTDPNASELARAVEQLEADSAKWAEELEEQERREWAEKGILIRAWDSVRPVPGEPRTSCTVFFKPGEAVHGDERALKEVRKSLTGDVRARTVSLPIGSAAEAVAKYTTRGGDEIQEVVYLVSDGDDLYRVEFITCNTGLKIDEIAESMMKTMRVKSR